MGDAYFVNHAPFYRRVLKTVSLETLKEFHHALETTTSITLSKEDATHLDRFAPFKKLSVLKIEFEEDDDHYTLSAKGLDQTTVTTFVVNAFDANAREKKRVYITDIDAGFQRSCKNLTHLSILCGFDGLQIDPATIFLDNAFPSLQYLLLGSSLAPTKTFSSIWCHKLMSLTTFGLNSMPMDISIVQIAPNVVNLITVFMPFDHIPMEWCRLKGLRKMQLRDTAFDHFPSDMLCCFYRLQSLNIQNNPTIPIHPFDVEVDACLPWLVDLVLLHFPIKKFTFVSRNNVQRFAYLSRLHIDNPLKTMRIWIRTSSSPEEPLKLATPRRVADMFPVLQSVSLKTMEEMDFPLQFLALPSLHDAKFFKGLDPRRDEQAIEFRLRTFLGNNANPFAKDIVRALLLGKRPPTHYKTGIRIEPYFIKWSAQLQCTSGDPFDGETRCPFCQEEFNETDRVYHETEPEITDNAFLSTGIILPEDAETEGRGCVVVCNMTEYDIKEYMKQKNKPVPNQEMIDSYQCAHRKHFYHRVCYSKLLLFEKPTGKFTCPSSRMQFFNEEE